MFGVDNKVPRPIYEMKTIAFLFWFKIIHYIGIGSQIQIMQRKHKDII